MLYKKYSIGNNPQTTLTTYILDQYKQKQNRPIVVICPGGGFLDCSPTEGECVALHFNRAGYHSAVLVYSTEATASGKCAFPQPVMELGEAMSLIRRHSSEWGIDKNKIIILGFSAGAHLCANYSCLWDTKLLERFGSEESRKPNATILCYPLVDMKQFMNDMEELVEESMNMQQVIGGKEKVLQFKDFYQASMKGLFGHFPPGEEEIDRCNPIKHIGKNHPPTFIWHTFDDRLTSSYQSMHYAELLHKYGVSCELHIFDHGEHGLSLADRTSAKKKKGVDEHLAHWAELAVEWIDRLFQIDEKDG